MKKNRNISPKAEMESRKESSNQQVVHDTPELSFGSLENKYPVILDEGKTVIYISDIRREIEVKLRYSTRKGRRSFSVFI